MEIIRLFYRKREQLELKYIGGLAKNRQVSVINQKTGKKQSQKRLDEIALSLPQNNFQEVTLEQDIPKTVWVATIEVETIMFKWSKNYCYRHE